MNTALLPEANKHVAIVGGGMSGMYVLKHLVEKELNRLHPGEKHTLADYAQGKVEVEAKSSPLHISLFEKSEHAGMPYSPAWVDAEHIVNIASDEAPAVIVPMHEWLKEKFAHPSDEDKKWIKKYNIQAEQINDKTLFPRHVFQIYFHDQLKDIKKICDTMGIQLDLPEKIEVTDAALETSLQGNTRVKLTLKDKDKNSSDMLVDKAILATGHRWSTKDDVDRGLYATPWPSRKLKKIQNQHVGIKGSSLTAVDTAFSLAHAHGEFVRNTSGELEYHPNEGTENFDVTMYSRSGVLPHLRFNFQFPYLRIYRYVSPEQLEQAKDKDGFIPLDFFLERYRQVMAQYQKEGFYPGVSEYSNIKPYKDEFFESLNLTSWENFSESVKEKSKKWGIEKCLEKRTDFYKSGATSHWEEVFDDIAYVLSFNAQYLSAEDRLRYQKTVKPLVSYITGFLPPTSVEKMQALMKAGKLKICTLKGKASDEDPRHLVLQDEAGEEKTYLFDVTIDALGQEVIPLNQFPFKGLLPNIQAPRFRFKDHDAGMALHDTYLALDQSPVEFGVSGIQPVAYLRMDGVAVDDQFRLKGKGGSIDAIHDISIPHINSSYPYHPGLPFCNHAGEIVAESVIQSLFQTKEQSPKENRGGGRRI